MKATAATQSTKFKFTASVTPLRARAAGTREISTGRLPSSTTVTRTHNRDRPAGGLNDHTSLEL
eukprot:53366-Rhodomonas_salina.1